ncbi:MAG: glycosyltransferase family 2 protein, partial [Pseudomonadota bacterium]
MTPRASKRKAAAHPAQERTTIIGQAEFRRRRFETSKDDVTQLAINGLAETRPLDSAKRLLSPAQTLLLAALVASLSASALLAPLATFLAVNLFTTAYFISAVGFRLWLLALGHQDVVSAAPAEKVDDATLPVITILAPLYHDAAALPMLAAAIDRLDYPADKKDVKLLLEEDDPETLAEAKRLKLDRRYDVIIVPARAPRTKPKACNYGLYLARGDLIVIYDAEDQPEPDQLRKAAAAFDGASKELACVQARLNYYNPDDNWLTRLFTLEYSLWFDWLLPGLQRMGAPIPLGGTSNFFRTDILREVGGWDPYNVTEDADLGLRLSRLRYRVEVLDSTTFEEANCRLDNWMRQRSRWMKGYLQTWLVHMRRPQHIIEATGWKGFIAVQLFVAGNLFSAVINPVMWLAFFLWLALGSAAGAALMPEPLVYLNLFALTAGNLFFMGLMAIGPLKRDAKALAPYGLTAPVYWLLTSLAAYKALLQAVTRPHYWEKTDHVISMAAIQKRK